MFVARIVRHKLCMIYAYFDFFVQKSFLTKNYFLTAEINWTPGAIVYLSFNIGSLPEWLEI